MILMTNFLHPRFHEFLISLTRTKIFSLYCQNHNRALKSNELSLQIHCQPKSIDFQRLALEQILLVRVHIQ